MAKGKRHYIAMAGLHGYLPNYCASHETYDDAVEDLATTHDLGQRRRRELKREGYLELNLKRDGNEYAEISECDCSDPACHNDNPSSAFHWWHVHRVLQEAD